MSILQIEQHMINARYAATSDGLLSPINHFFEDKSVSEIMLNRPHEVFVEKNGEIKRFDIPEYDEKMLSNLFQLIAGENSQIMNESNPLLSGSLRDGSRIQLVLPPTSKNYVFAIRRQVAKDFDLNDYNQNNYYKKMVPYDIESNSYAILPDSEKLLINLFHANQWDEFIRHCILFRKNIVISGGTSSGKTTFLNACLRYIDLNDRLIILEDTREINISHPNQINLLASKGDQGLSKISMQDLVQCSLRLRPDRIIMGEIRGKEIMDFVSACSTGHEGSLTTIHANNPRVAFMRMTQMYKLNQVPSMTDADIMRELKEVVDVIIQLNKTKEGRIATSIYYKNANIKK